jgi:uncharacterized protein
MRVGVTGASGFIGSALAASLRERGDQVVTFTRRTDDSAAGDSIFWDPARQHLDAGDLRRAGALDAVVHLAGAGIADRRWSAARKREILLSRTRSTQLLVRVLAEVDADTHLVCGSAIGYYGSRGDEILSEESTPGDDYLANVCREWEREAESFRLGGARVVTLRTGIVASASGGALARQLPLFRVGLGGRLGSGTQWVSPIALADAVRAIGFILDQRMNGPVNLVAPCTLTNRDFTSALARALHRPAFLSVPSLALRAALGSELATGVVLASQRVIPSALEKAGYNFLFPDVDSLLRSALTAAA